MPSFLSFLTASFREKLSQLPVISAWFNTPDTMDPNPWNYLVERPLKQPAGHTLQLFISATSKIPNPESLMERLQVVWVWYNKLQESPQHEYFVFETVDREENNQIRRFIFERTVPPELCNNHTEATNASKHPDNLQPPGISNFFRSSRSPSPSRSLFAAEEGTSTYYPPVSTPSPQLSAFDGATLNATKIAYSLSESCDKSDFGTASDRFLGEYYVDQRRYASGRCVWQLKPGDLNFFQAVLLAHVMHEAAPTYSRLKYNCFWLATTFFDCLIELFGVDLSTTPEDRIRERRYLPLNPDMPGRWMGLKITISDPAEIAAIVQKYKKEHTKQISQVMLFSLQISIPY